METEKKGRNQEHMANRNLCMRDTLGHWYLPRREGLHCSSHQEDQREGCQQASFHGQQDCLQGKQVCPQVRRTSIVYPPMAKANSLDRVAAAVVASTAKHYYRPDLRKVFAPRH